LEAPVLGRYMFNVSRDVEAVVEDTRRGTQRQAWLKSSDACFILIGGEGGPVPRRFGGLLGIRLSFA
jgi:hypothetical protein